MSEEFTLEALNESIEKEFAPLTFRAGEETFVLRNPVRIDETSRKAIAEYLTSLDTARKAAQEEGASDMDENVVRDVVENVLKLAVEGGSSRGNKLLKVLDHDIVREMRVFEKWMSVTSPGEASDSPS